MRKIVCYIFAGVLTFLSCQKGQEPINEPSSEPFTRSGDSSPWNGSVLVSKEVALKIVEPITNKYPDRWVDISNDIIPAQTRIAYNTMGHRVDVDDCSYCQSPDFDSWLLVIDKEPALLGKKHLLHIFVDIQSGVYSTMELEGRAIVEWDTSRNTYIPSKRVIGISETNTSREPERSGGTTRWAVIISGGCDLYNNGSEFYNDCVNIYFRLTQHLGYPKGNIYCLIADGTDTAIDQRTDYTTYTNSNPDLDNDGTIDVHYRANKASISSVFDDLSLLVSPGDEVFIFMTGHGNTGGCFYLWDNETLYPSDLNTELNKLGSSVMIDVVMGQSYSGEYISTLSASNRTIATSCSATESSVLVVPFTYTGFLHYWTNAIVTFLTIEDKYVSPADLFYYASSFVTGYQHPQYSSTPTDFGVTHSLAGEKIPYLMGDDILSTNRYSLYTIVNYPNPSSVTWSTDSEAYIISHTDSTAVVRGNISTPGRFCEPGAFVHVDLVVDGKQHRISKKISSVWKPGQCLDGHNIWGSNGNYQIRHLGGEYGYVWQSDNPDWQITGYNNFMASIFEGNTYNPVNLIVYFYDPLGEMIVVIEQVH